MDIDDDFVSDVACPVSSLELGELDPSPLVRALLEVRLLGLPDRLVLGTKWRGEDWPERKDGERPDLYLFRAAAEMQGAIVLRWLAGEYEAATLQ